MTMEFTVPAISDINSTIISKTKSKSIVWAHLCRILAIYGVILIHSSGAFFYSYNTLPTPGWLSANLLDSLVRCSIPIFVMLSGALLLHYRASMTTTPRNLIKRVMKVLIPLLSWSLIFKMYLVHHSPGPLNLHDIISQPAMYHLWFVYMVIGLYLLLPLFEIIYREIINRHDLQLYLLVLWLIVTVMPVYFPAQILQLMYLNSLFGYGGYFLIGAVLVNSPSIRKISSFWLWVLYALGVLITFGLTWMYSYKAQAPVEQAYQYFSPNVFLSAICIFILFTRVKILSQNTSGFLEWLSDKAFLIYFIHVLALEIVRYNATVISLIEYLPTIASILMISIITFTISTFFAAVIRLIPGAKYVFG